MVRRIFFACILLSAACSDKPEEAFPEPDPALVYFLVEEIAETHGDSYILPLKEQSHIDEARAIIAAGETRIVVAEITRNKNDHYSLNRDLVGGRIWSWHVREFEGFADNTIEILDGWPGYVEENYDEWVRITKGSGEHGVIGFWNYSITREVSYDELYN